MTISHIITLFHDAYTGSPFLVIFVHFIIGQIRCYDKSCYE